MKQAKEDFEIVQLEMLAEDVKRYGPVVTSNCRPGQVVPQEVRIHCLQGQFYFVCHGAGKGQTFVQEITPEDAALRSRIGSGKLSKFGAKEFRKLGLNGTPGGVRRITTKSRVRIVR